MTLNLTLPVQQHTDFSPRIAVIGVGGGGCNAVNNMIAMGLAGVDFVVANTDAQSLVNSKAEHRVQLGPHLTQGLGAGAKPEIGRAAAEEATEELARHLEGCHMVFVTAGMGGGTGTGAAPVIARMARERGVLTVGVVTKPFDFEGPKRKRACDLGLEELQAVVDTLIVIPNQNLFRMANERTTFAEAFKMADNVLYMGVRGVTDLMVNPGLVNLDFADIRTVMAEMGKAMMGTGEAEGDDRAVKAAESAINNPLLEDTSMGGAKGVLINITGGYDMTLYEVEEATSRIRQEVDEEANIIFGTSIDETMNGRLRVSVVATGIDAIVAPSLVQHGTQARPEGLTLVPGGRPAPRPALATPPGGAQPGATQPGATPRRVMVGPSMLRPAMASGPVTAGAAYPLGPVALPEEMDQAAMDAAQQPFAAPAGARPHTASAPASTAQPTGGLRALFRTMTGGGAIRRALSEPTPAPVAPRLEPIAGGTRPIAQAPQQDEMGLDIPTFLRRQSN